MGTVFVQVVVIVVSLDMKSKLVVIGFHSIQSKFHDVTMRSVVHRHPNHGIFPRQKRRKKRKLYGHHPMFLSVRIQVGTFFRRVRFVDHEVDETDHHCHDHECHYYHRYCCCSRGPLGRRTVVWTVIVVSMVKDRSNR